MKKAMRRGLQRFKKKKQKECPSKRPLSDLLIKKKKKKTQRFVYKVYTVTYVRARPLHHYHLFYMVYRSLRREISERVVALSVQLRCTKVTHLIVRDERTTRRDIGVELRHRNSRVPAL